ncbi:hypothetical protein FGG08_002864 [Glutinoglossum americanum]|uniref:Nitrogen permease regulator 3 n=1 Tax=Glutinoglossum americanum TaxID=1670608 RepID=A0A9P8I5F0_9PEZI|nr:hypothetical protein FGG08_002864 [Glutinoglossum americanum]
MADYLSCLKKVRGTNDPECRWLAKAYLQCRMDHNLMAKDEFKNLGFGEEDRVVVNKPKKSPETSTPSARVCTCITTAAGAFIIANMEAAQLDANESNLQTLPLPPAAEENSSQTPTAQQNLNPTKPAERTMSPPALPPNPCLVAILLVVKSRAGPRFVFHYPPYPREDAPTYLTSWRGGHSTNSSLTDDSGDFADLEEYSSDEEELELGTRGSIFRSDGDSRRERRRRVINPEDEEDDYSDESERGRRRDEGRKAQWESLFNFSTDGLEQILSPSKGYNKKKFEVGLDPLVFLSYPCHVREDGLWKKKRERRKKPKKRGSSESKDLGDTSEGVEVNGKDNNEDKPTARIAEETVEEAVEMSIGDDSYDDDEESVVSEKSSAITMFNMVFVLNPPDLEYQVRVQEMYENVAKKFAKALKYEQARSNYVWTESELILTMKDQAKEKGMSEVYHSISSSKIAHVIINNSFDVSLQIPIITETSVLPSAIETQMPGLWLTTANSFDDDENVEDNMLAKHFALLFLDDVSTILKEIETEPKDLSGPLAHYVRCSKPTMSFLQVSIQHDIPLTDIQILARHLIYWRRARAIPPLHHRDTYIVSPNADMKGLRSQSVIYAQKFPTLPSLPKMLSMLSGKPRPYGSIIPSKDHRQTYLEILAWLVRGGWVTQLRTFAWAYVCKNVKIEVAQEMAKEEAIKNGAYVGTSSPPRSSNDPGPPDIRSGYLSPPAFSDASSISSVASTVKPGKDDPSLEPSLILEPHKANALECRWLEKIAEKLEPEEARIYFPVFTKYFNGQHALEKIAVRENLTRKDVRRLLAAMEVALVEVRHW